MDKSGRYTVSSRASYKAQGDQHTLGDRVVEWDEINRIQNEVVCHAKALANVFCMSKEWGEKEEERTHRAMATKSTVIPQMLITQKDHKALQENGLPKTRAMCGASQTMNQRISDLLTDILQALFKSEPTHESLSTESYIYKIDRLNQDIKAGRVKAPNLMVGSLDVEALYPSTDIHKAAQVLKNRIKKSPMNVSNVDYRWGLIYLALTIQPDKRKNYPEILELLPRRLSKKGSHPTIKTVHTDETKERWSFPIPVGLLTPENKKTILAHVIEQLMIEVFQTHIYEWEGRIYLQMAGGPIGLRSSGPVARVLMDYWIDMLLEIARETERQAEEDPVTRGTLRIHLITKYVDDVFLALERIQPGMRWDPEMASLRWTEENHREDIQN